MKSLMGDCSYRRYLTSGVLLLFLVVGVGLVYKVTCARNEMVRVRTAELEFPKGAMGLGDYKMMKIDSLLDTVSYCKVQSLRFMVYSPSGIENMLKRMGEVVGYLKSKGLKVNSVKETIAENTAILMVPLA